MAYPHTAFQFNGTPVLEPPPAAPTLPFTMTADHPPQPTPSAAANFAFQPMTGFGPALTSQGQITAGPWGRAPEMNGLSDTMSELVISDCSQPPPSKIRRRNAITIQDPQFIVSGDPLLPNISPVPNGHQVQPQDAFHNSFLMQRMEELQKRLGGSLLQDVEVGSGSNGLTVNTSRTFDEVSPPPPSPVATSNYNSINDDYPDYGPVKRKVPTKQSSTASPAPKSIGGISLHPDFQKYQPRGELDLPESILRLYRANKCNAVVLYQPPMDLMAQFRSRTSGENSNEDGDDVAADDNVAEDVVVEDDQGIEPDDIVEMSD